MKRKCAPGFVAVQPVQFACGHRYHEVSEEVFYIIRDHAAVRTPEGEKNLKKGMRSLRMSVPASCPMWCTSRIRLPEWYVLPPACTISRSPEQYSCSGERSSGFSPGAVCLHAGRAWGRRCLGPFFFPADSMPGLVYFLRGGKAAPMLDAFRQVPCTEILFCLRCFCCHPSFRGWSRTLLIAFPRRGI